MVQKGMDLGGAGNSERSRRPSERCGARPGHPGTGKYAVFLYAAYCKGFAKLGISEDPKCRVRSMQSGNPFPIELLGMVALDQVRAIEAEHQAMLMLDDVHWVGEWFKCSRNRARYVVQSATRDVIGPPSSPVKGIKGPRFFKQGRRVETPDGRFASSAAAALHYGISRQGIYLRLKVGREGWRFLE